MSPLRLRHAGQHLGPFARLAPNLEKLITRKPDAKARLEAVRQMSRAVAARRAEAAAAKGDES